MNRMLKRPFDRPNRKRIHQIKWPLLMLLLLLLAGCNLSLGGAMEEATAKQYEEVSDLELVQQKPWEGNGIALVTFNAVNDRGTELEGCQGIGLFRSGLFGYSVISATSTCDRPVAEVVGREANALTTAGYGSASLVRHDVSVAFGVVNDPAGVEIRVFWEDGETVTVDVVDGSYLVPRRGITDIEQVVLLDADGTVIAAETRPVGSGR